MSDILADAAGAASRASMRLTSGRADALFAAANAMLPLLETGCPLSSTQLRDVMTGAFAGSDAEGAWDWKMAYDACEAAQILLLRRYGRALVRRNPEPQRMLAALERIAARLPTHTRRSEAGQALQQFSTPLGLAYVAATAAMIEPADVVLEPSAGTGMLAVHAERMRANLVLNELGETRAELLTRIMDAPVSRHDAASIDDRLPAGPRPTVVLMNPPFSAIAHVDRAMKDAALRHIASALARLEPGGRLVAITAATCGPENGIWRAAFEALQRTGRIVFTAAIDGRIYRKHGTTIETRLTVIDKVPADDPAQFVPSAGIAPDSATLLQWVERFVPPRAPIASMPPTTKLAGSPSMPTARPRHVVAPSGTAMAVEAEELAYQTVDWAPASEQLGDTIYEAYGLQSLLIPGAQPHPTPLVQSASMASVAPPKPNYRPHIPAMLVANGTLSDAQIEAIIYAGEAHSGHLSGAWTVDGAWDAAAFQIIHTHLDAALEASGVTSSAHGTLNAQAKSAARSAFESVKQRFFNHLITAMQTPSTIASIESDLEAGHAAVVQIVSTGEALQERRLAEIPTDQWDDVRLDITPREYVLSYLDHSFPVQLYEPYTDGEGNLASRPVFDPDGNPVLNRDACRRRDQMIERLAALPPVPGALDQIVQHFGSDAVAEVTGRSRRIVPRTGIDGLVRFAVENRPASANIAETHAFMDDAKRILIFSEAGGTGRSYHADLGAKNQRRRIHYLLEAGWKADAAIQGFGRTNRTNQKQPPLFRPVSTDVKAQKRFISTIARRLDSLGAITRGQRQTGGQNMFRPEDNLESFYAHDALRQLYMLLVRGRIEGCSLAAFETATGLSLLNRDGSIKDELPGITTFLNRMLALTIDLQNILFEAFEGLLTARIEGAIASGTFESGLETLKAESFTITERRTIYTHPGTGALTHLLTIARKEKLAPVSLERALELAGEEHADLVINARSGRAAVKLRARSIVDDDGAILARVRLVRPMEASTLFADLFATSHWEKADRASFCTAWTSELAELPEFEISTLHMVTGLLLPIWRRLPNESTRVYRLQTDAGERVIGRRVSPAWAASIDPEAAPHITPDMAWSMLIADEASIEIAEGQTLRRVRAMHEWRVELTGFNDLGVERLKSMGLISEIVSWKLRLYVPTGAVGGDVLEKLLDRFPVVRVNPRKAA